MTLCKDCKHYVKEFREAPKCVALAGLEHPVTGAPIECIDPSFMRATLCGWTDPKLFEPNDGKEE